MYVFLRSMSSNEDPSARRDQEVKETEEVKVGERSAAGEHPLGAFFWRIQRKISDGKLK